MTIADQLERMAHAVRALETLGCRVVEARASKAALPLVALHSATPCPGELRVGEPLIEAYPGYQHVTVETTLAVCVTWCEVAR